MTNYCAECKILIKKTRNIYFGYDNKFCSNICRNNFSKIVSEKDPRLFYPHEWRNLKKKEDSYCYDFIPIVDIKIESDFENIITNNNDSKKIIINNKKNLNCIKNNHVYDDNYTTYKNKVINNLKKIQNYINIFILSAFTYTDLIIINSTLTFSMSNIFTKLYF